MFLSHYFVCSDGKDVTMKKMILLPYDKYQRLLANSSPREIEKKDLETEQPVVSQQGEETEQTTVNLEESRSSPPPQINQQSGRGDIPPPPGIPVKRKLSSPPTKKIKWLKL